MKKLRALLLVVLALLVLLPYFLGFEIKNRYRGLLSQFEEAGYQLASHEYDQGFYHSQARSVLAIPVYTPQGDKTDIRVKIVSDIVHGPYTISDGWLGYLTRFESRFFHQDQALFPEDMGSQIVTKMAFSGDGTTRLDIPSLANTLELENNLFLDFSGLQGQIGFNVVNGQVSINAYTPGLRLSSPGQGELRIGKVQLESDSARGVADLMLGKGSFEIEHIAMNDWQRGFGLDVRNIAISAHTFAEAENVNVLASYSVDAFDVDKEHFGPVQIELELTSISAEAMARIQENIKDMQRQQLPPEQQGMAIMGVFMSVMPSLLEQNPGVSLKKFELNTPQGMIQASLSLKVDDMSITDMGVSDKFLQKLVGDASLQIPESLLRQLMSNSTRQQLLMELGKNQDESVELPDPESIEELVEQQVSAQLESLIGQGLLERRGLDLVTVANLKAGLLSINGKMIPLPAMQ